MTNRQSDETVEMLPCPFCGCETPQVTETHRNHWHVECPKCGVRRATFANGGVEEDKARAIRSWNKRTPAPVDAGLVERLRTLEAWGEGTLPQGIPLPIVKDTIRDARAALEAIVSSPVGESR